LHRTVHKVKSFGKRVGIAVNPATPAALLEEILPEIDQVLVVTADPGIGHQHFLRRTLSKISLVGQIIDRMNPGCDLEVDGGIDAETAPLAVAAGANILVAGTSVFGNRSGAAAGMQRLGASLSLANQ
jgi:ribulose-phosphate 3-epimerase